MTADEWGAILKTSRIFDFIVGATRIAWADFTTLAALCVLTASLPLPAIAQEDEQLQWFGDLTDGRALLSYGIPESDYVPLSMMCDQGEREITVYLEYEAVEAKVGDTVSVRIKAGGTEVTFAAVGEPQEMDDLLHLKGHAKLDEAFKGILTASGDLTLEIETTKIIYPLEGAAEAATHLIEICGEKQAAAGDNLEVTVTNAGKLALQSLSIRDVKDIVLDADPFGYDLLEPGQSRRFVIPGGARICTYELSVLFQEEDGDECCSDPLPIATQNLCENNEFIVRDPPTAATGDDPWIGEWEGKGIAASIRRGAVKPEYLVIDLTAGVEGCAGAVTLYGKPDGRMVLGESYDPGNSDAPVCRVGISISEAGEMEAATAGPCTYYHGASCGFDGTLARSD